jgi:hypothetical protein
MAEASDWSATPDWGSLDGILGDAEKRPEARNAVEWPSTMPPIEAAAAD